MTQRIHRIRVKKKMQIFTQLLSGELNVHFGAVTQLKNE